MIAEHHQVICITHLPQIAAMADAHFSIEKSVENETTISTIRRLTEDEQVTELARMLGGVRITDTVLESAREMLNLAQNAKNKRLNQTIIHIIKTGYSMNILFLFYAGKL